MRVQMTFYGTQVWQVQNNLACYGLGMRQPAHGCNVRAKRLTHFTLTFLS
jgi:hypothetical protein